MVDLLADNPDQGRGRAREEQLPHSFPDLLLVYGRLRVGHQELLGRHHPPLLRLLLQDTQQPSIPCLTTPKAPSWGLSLVMSLHSRLPECILPSGHVMGQDFPVTAQMRKSRLLSVVLWPIGGPRLRECWLRDRNWSVIHPSRTAVGLCIWQGSEKAQGLTGCWFSGSDWNQAPPGHSWACRWCSTRARACSCRRVRRLDSSHSSMAPPATRDSICLATPNT